MQTVETMYKNERSLENEESRKRDELRFAILDKKRKADRAKEV